MSRRSSGTLAVAPDLRDRLLALWSAAGTPPADAAVARELVEEALGLVVDLDDAPVTRTAADGPIEATRRSGHIVAAGPDVFLTAGPHSDRGGRPVRLAAGPTMWIVDTDGDGERHLRVSVEGGIVADWTWTAAGEVLDGPDRDAALTVAMAELAEVTRVELPDLGPVTMTTEAAEEGEETTPGEPGEPVEPAWVPTHRVAGTAPLAVGGVQTGTLAPGTTLAPRLEVRVVETTPDGWALVECSNGWRCYVDPRGLQPVSADPPPREFTVDAPVEGRTASGDAIWLLPGESYPKGEESDGWMATEVGGTPVWVPAWAARPG